MKLKEAKNWDLDISLIRLINANDACYVRTETSVISGYVYTKRYFHFKHPSIKKDYGVNYTTVITWGNDGFRCHNSTSPEHTDPMSFIPLRTILQEQREQLKCVRKENVIQKALKKYFNKK